MILSAFPEFNEYGTPLLILVLQGYVFAVLLFLRYLSKGHLADLFLALLLFVTGFRRTSYIIGFMGWYDTYRTTKVNYYLVHLTLALGPLLYFYVKSITKADFKFRRRDWWHFAPVTIIVVYGLLFFAYDASQSGFSEVQNGVWLENVQFKYIAPFEAILNYFSQLLYYAFSIQLFWNYRQRILQFFSNTYKVELNWIRNFLIVYVGLFLINLSLDVIDAEIVDLHWTQFWWGHIAAALVMLYVGIKGYFTDLSKLFALTYPLAENKSASVKKEIENLSQIKEWQTQLLAYMKLNQPYFNSELTLQDLARQLNWGTNQLSQVINSGLNKNFNDFINEYRVEEVKKLLLEGKNNHLSLLGIAYECGFNSKATFNRTFKKITHQTPSEFISQQQESKVPSVS